MKAHQFKILSFKSMFWDVLHTSSFRFGFLQVINLNYQIIMGLQFRGM